MFNQGDRIRLNIPIECIPGDEDVREYLKQWDGKTGIVVNDNDFISFQKNLGYPHEYFPKHIKEGWLTVL